MLDLAYRQRNHCTQTMIIRHDPPGHRQLVQDEGFHVFVLEILIHDILGAELPHPQKIQPLGAPLQNSSLAGRRLRLREQSGDDNRFHKLAVVISHLAIGPGVFWGDPRNRRTRLFQVGMHCYGLSILQGNARLDRGPIIPGVKFFQFQVLKTGHDIDRVVEVRV